MHFRRPLINFLLKISSSNIPRNLEFIKGIQYKDSKHLKKLQIERLKKLIIYSYEKVPYYRALLKKYQIIKSNNIKLENLSKLPILTKDVIKEQGINLYSRERLKRGSFFNFTGGSTGENISFIQDKYYRDWNIANKLFYLEMTGKYVGEKEVKLWGSERDLFEGTVGIKNKAINFIYNRRMLNCLRMSSRDMEKYVRTINDWRPKIIWAYANAIFELSNYIERNSLKVYAPNSIICCATTLYPYMREKVERVFNTKVYNQYGGREVGDIACECEYYKMHIFNHTHFIEIVDGNDELIEEGIGNIIVTSLTNYSMPFLRYKVGDMGEIANDACNCNRAFNHFQKFIGRDIETFYKQDGEIVLGEFFALLLFKDFIKKFQIVQEKYDHIGVKLILDGKRTDLKSKLNEIQNAIKQVMGQDCEVEFQVVDELDSKLPSGKNIYVISKVRK